MVSVSEHEFKLTVELGGMNVRKAGGVEEPR
jgi:hypothetical protein